MIVLEDDSSGQEVIMTCKVFSILIPLRIYIAISNWIILWDDHITVVFFLGFQLATGKKGRFPYDLVRASSQTAPGRLTAIASGMDIVLLKVSVVVPKPFDTGTTRPISCSGQLVPLFGTPCTIF